jgi:hypothetical protein
VRKNRAPIYVDKAPKAWDPWVLARLAIVATAIGPFAYEGVLIVYASWMRAIGRGAAIRTPFLNQLGALARESQDWVTTQFRSVPWNPQAVLVVGVTSCLVCMILIRGRGSRIE